MTDVVLIHHVQGLTDGVLAFADGLREGGHVVHTPDIFRGERPATIDDGLRLTQELGDAEIGDRLTRQLVDLPSDVVWAGISYGVSMAQLLAQTQPGARGALLYAACIPVTGDWAFGPWPKGVPVQIHGKDQDPFFAGEGDLDAAKQLVETVGPELGQLYVYPGEEHLYLDSSLPDYDAAATALTLERSLELLARVR